MTIWFSKEVAEAMFLTVCFYIGRNGLEGEAFSAGARQRRLSQQKASTKQDRNEDVRAMSTRVCTHVWIPIRHTGGKSTGSSAFNFAPPKSAEKWWLFFCSFMLPTHTYMMEIEKNFTYRMFQIQTKQNKWTSNIRGALFNMVITHSIVVILERFCGNN